jgi:hypothetical protein
MWFIENATSGSQNIIISQGSGANVTIAAGQTKAVYSDGAGAGAAFVDAFAALSVAGVSPTELGVLDGITASTAELNIMDGVTATTAELNIMDGVTASTAELNIMDGVTASTAELNIMDGVTASTAQLNRNDIATLGLVEASKVVTADANSNVIWEDNKKAAFGNAGDLEIYHDASHSWIKDTGTGNLKISAGNFEVVGAADTNSAFIYGIEGGSLYAYHNGNAKLQTISTGITVTGTLDINTNDAAGNTIDIIGEGSTSGSAICANWTTGSAYLDFRLGGLTTAYTEMRLYSGGDLHVDGNVIAYSTTISDERLKTDIVKIDSALDKVDQINGYTFTYTTDGKKSAGVIAQEVEKVLPSAITESKLPLKVGEDDETEYKTVQYDQLIGLLVEAVKELKAEVAELKGQ